jgi:predicted Zn-dependent protease with MMP-like domain
MPYHVSRERFAELVEQAIALLPPQFARALDEDVRIEIRDRPTRRQLRSVGLDEDELLLGLYEGHPLTDRSIESTGRMPDVIFIFQEDCELVSDSEQQLIDEVRVTVLHELGHYFGLDEDELDRLGYG